jgi:hypothetical protein
MGHSLIEAGTKSTSHETKGGQQAVLITKLTMGPVLFLSGFAIGVVVGTNLDWSPRFSSPDPRAQGKEESLYQQSCPAWRSF